MPVRDIGDLDGVTHVIVAAQKRLAGVSDAETTGLLDQCRGAPQRLMSWFLDADAVITDDGRILSLGEQIAMIVSDHAIAVALASTSSRDIGTGRLRTWPANDPGRITLFWAALQFLERQTPVEIALGMSSTDTSDDDRAAAIAEMGGGTTTTPVSGDALSQIPTSRPAAWDLLRSAIRMLAADPPVRPV